MKNEKIFITGGAGYLGKNLVKRFYNDNEITVFSRDESKHYYIKKQFPKVNFIVGDVRNYELLEESMRGHTIGIFAASMKQIEAVDQNPEEALQIIIHGAFNSRRSAIKNKLKAGIFISTDKSRCPTTLYGAMKFVAGEAFILNAEKETTKLTSVIYGNVLNSTGSIIPLIWNSIENNYPVTLYSENMTRFMVDVEQAIDCIEMAADYTGYSIVPNLKAFKIKDLFEIYAEKFNLKWNKGVPRISEKEHEQMISPYETNRVTYVKEKDIFLIHYKNLSTGHIFPEYKGFDSGDNCINKEELDKILSKYNYFKP